MIDCCLGSSKKRLRRVLCLGAHSDDIEIGCGGTILRLLTENPEIEVYWKVFSSTPVRRREAEKGARLFLGNAKSRNVVIRNYKDRFFPSLFSGLKADFDKMKKQFAPDLIFTHFRHDLHQDHRVVCDLTWNAFRDDLILEYEIPKYDGDLGQPNFFVSLDRQTCEQKAVHIQKAFVSQRSKQWFGTDTFLALPRLRGIECNASSGYAEAFHCRKLVW
jgi:LmbE family N-acetylglucosaminyl deacetylase